MKYQGLFYNPASNLLSLLRFNNQNCNDDLIEDSDNIRPFAVPATESFDDIYDDSDEEWDD